MLDRVELRDMKWGTALYNRAIRWIHAQFSVAGDEPSVRVVGGVFSERFVAHESRGHGDSAPILRSTGLTCLNTRKDYEHCGPKDS
ncbi:hypothetical protein FRC18_005011 [Serendipita sp. 400]|nr:hypothetical protein FRC18_005011 [Serendipita sp. 400]